MPKNLFITYVPTERKHFGSDKNYGAVTRRADDMSPDEVLEAYRQNCPEDWEPTPEQKAKNELYEMPMEELKAKADAEQKSQAAAELEQFRTQNAYSFMAVEPRYKVTPENAELMIGMLDRLGMRGTVSDMRYCFDELNAQRKLDVNFVPPAPKKIWTEAELRAMPLEQAAACIEQMGRDGIF